METTTQQSSTSQLNSGLCTRDAAIMPLVLRALLVLGLASLLHAAGKGRTISARLALDSSVQPQTTRMLASNVANTSLSPWTYRDSCVESRLPRRISHAQCLTSGCLSLQGGGENAALEAKPIYYQVLVLHRIPRRKHSNKGGRKRRNKYDFRLGTEVITVGCTCVRPSVVAQQ